MNDCHDEIYETEKAYRHCMSLRTSTPKSLRSRTGKPLKRSSQFNVAKGRPPSVGGGRKARTLDHVLLAILNLHKLEFYEPKMTRGGRRRGHGRGEDVLGDYVII